ncbi:MAG: aldo/keto reductase [Phycisphaerae bacterium SM23_33]|nr:MAG: aldo/keto reductase [Phycisphaerae bacterium SM23_33]
MEKKVLGRTGLEVTQLSFGAMELRFGPDGERKVADEAAERLLNAVLDAGINFIDTAPDYGLSEERIGRFISSRRGEYHLATKCGCDPADKGGKGGHVWSRDQLLKNIAGSLQRLRTDHVDILQLHNPRGDDVPMDELVDTLKEIQAQGLTRFISISHTLPWLNDLIPMGVFDTYQIPYSCLEPQHHDVISRAAEAGAGVIIRGGIGRGGPEAAVTRRVKTELWQKAKLDELCREMPPPELILRYTLKHPGCHTTIVGTCNVEHLKANVAAAEKGPLPDDLYNEVTRRVAKAME